MDNSAPTNVSTIPSVEKVDPSPVTQLPFRAVLTYQPSTAATAAAIPSEKMQIDSPAMPTQPNDTNPTPTADHIAHMIYWTDDSSTSTNTMSSNSTTLPVDKRAVAFTGDLPKPTPSPRSEVNIRQALTENYDVWKPLADKLLQIHQDNGFIRQVDARDTPRDAQ
jgi:hypothetical protein